MAVEDWANTDVRKFLDTILPGHVCLERFRHTTGRVLCSLGKEDLRRQVRDEEATNVIWAELGRLRAQQAERAAAPEQSFLLHVRTAAEVALELEVLPRETVLEIKVRVAKLEGTPFEAQRLMWNGVPMLDRRSLASYAVSDGAVLLLVPRLGARQAASGASRAPTVPGSGMPRPRVPIICAEISRPFPLSLEFSGVSEYRDFMLALQRCPCAFLEILPAMGIQEPVQTRISFDRVGEALHIDTVGDILVEGARYAVLLHLAENQKTAHLVTGSRG